MSSRPSSKPRRALFGFVERREAWCLSWRGRIILALVLVVAVVFLFFNVHSFLAPNRSVPATVLVVEGWIPDYALKAALAEATAHSYEMVFTTGGPALPDSDSDYDSFAHSAAVKLKRFGMLAHKIEEVPARRAGRDRTYTSAVALRTHLEKTRREVHSLNVITLGVHARRTRLLYEKAFGPNVRIGIVSIPSQEYEPRRWYRFSEGVKEVVSEGMAYCYVRLFFHP